MKNEINIYGDIVAFNYWGDNEYSLKNLKDDLDNTELKEGDILTINIHTYGGDTTTAFGMFNLIKRFKNEQKINVKTRVDGYCASSGVILLLAGDERVGSEYLKPFVHNAWTYSFEMNKEEAKRIYEDLDKVDNEIAELYASETSITKEEALQFMNESRDLTIDECKKYGFYTEIENVRVIENKIFNSIITRNEKLRRKPIKNNNKMTDEKKTIWNRIKNEINSLFQETGANNKILFTSLNEELDFYELAEDAEVKVGDKATFGGKPAGESNGGEYLMQSGETYIFEGEELKEIKPKDEGANDDIENLKQDLEAKDNEISNLKTQVQTKNSRIAELETQLKKANNLLKEINDFKIEDEPRDPKPNPTPTKLNQLFKNIK